MPEHHPTADLRRGFARSELGAGAALLVESHLERCDQCAKALRAESRGGFGAFDAVRCENGSGKTAKFPVAIEKFSHGRWRWAGPGARCATVEGAAGLGERVYLLKAGAGRKLARHGHRGNEWVLVLKGAFRDGQDRYGVGDVSERHAHDVHALQVLDEGECICLVVNDGPPELFGTARWIAPFLRL